VGCVDLTDGGSASKSPSDGSITPKPDVELSDQNGRFSSATYRDAILGRAHSTHDYSGTWVMIVSGYAYNSERYQESFVARSIMDITNRLNSTGTEMIFTNQCMFNDLTIALATRELVDTNIPGLQEFHFVDNSYFYYISKKDIAGYSDVYEKFEYIKLSDDRLNIGTMSEHLVNESGITLIDEVSNINCYSESKTLSIGPDIIWTLSDIDIHSESNLAVSIEKPITIYGSVYFDDNIYYLEHKSNNGPRFELNENEGAEVLISVSVMHVEGTTGIMLDSGVIAGSHFEVNLSNILNSE
jgi:hypothetical protein